MGSGPRPTLDGLGAVAVDSALENIRNRPLRCLLAELTLYPLSISMALALTGKLALKQRQYERSAKIDLGADSNVTRGRE